MDSAAVTTSIGADLWSEIERLDPSLIQGVPEILPEFELRHNIEDVGKLTGLQFVYTGHALGLSLEAQDKLIELVDGRGMRAGASGPRIKWPNMSSLLADLHANRRSDLRFGSKVVEELRRLSLDAAHSREG